jgi:hypothetical protein
MSYHIDSVAIQTTEGRRPKMTTDTRNEELRLMTIPEMQEKFREAMISLEMFDLVYFREEGKVASFTGYFSENGYEFSSGDEILMGDPINTDDPLRLPLPIDPVNPERGLWGMVDWSHWDIATNHLGEVSLFNTASRLTIDYTTPTLALLRALMAQEGIEDKEGKG